MHRNQVQHLRPDEIIATREADSIIYLPIGPLEWHGPHLPLGVDPLRAELAAKALAQEVGGVVLPTLYMGTERERRPDMLKSIGFGGDEYIVGMDFPENSLPSLYLKEEVFALVLRNYLELLIDGWGFRNVVLVNGHGAENHLNVIERLRRELTETRGAKVVVVMPALNYPDHGWSHATKEETETLLPHFPDSVDLLKLPPREQRLLNVRWAVVDDLTFRGQPTSDFTVRDEEDPRDSDADRGKHVFEETIRQLKERLLGELER